MPKLGIIRIGEKQDDIAYERNAVKRCEKLSVAYEKFLLPEDAQEKQVIETIVNHCGIHILCIVDEDAVAQEHYRRILNTASEEKEKDDGLFYRGTLQNGEVLETENSIVILGDIHSGAKVISKGNILILGSCRGSLYAGATGDRNCFAAALVMKPVQIRIADKTARSAITKYSDHTEYKAEPKIAYIKNDHIFVESIKQETLQELSITQEK